MDKALVDRGMQVRRDMYGADKANAELAGTNSFNRPFYDLVSAYCFGEVWGSDNISKRDRSLITVAQVAALGKVRALSAHVENALNNGVTKDELREIIMHTALYCGIPAAGEASRVVMDVLKARGIE